MLAAKNGNLIFFDFVGKPNLSPAFSKTKRRVKAIVGQLFT